MPRKNQFTYILYSRRARLNISDLLSNICSTTDVTVPDGVVVDGLEQRNLLLALGLVPASVRGEVGGAVEHFVTFGTLVLHVYYH